MRRLERTRARGERPGKNGFCGARWLYLWAALLPATALAVDDSASRTEPLMEIVKAALEKEPPPVVLAGVDLQHAPSEVKKIARTLRETRIHLVLEKAELPAVVDLLCALTGLNFVISAKARAAIESEKPEVTIALRGLPAESVLNLLALHLGEYRFIIRHGAVLLIHKDEYRPVKTVRLYPVADLIRPRPDFPAPPLALSSPDEKK